MCLFCLRTRDNMCEVTVFNIENLCSRHVLLFVCLLFCVIVCVFDCLFCVFAIVCVLCSCIVCCVVFVFVLLVCLSVVVLVDVCWGLNMYVFVGMLQTRDNMCEVTFFGLETMCG